VAAGAVRRVHPTGGRAGRAAERGVAGGADAATDAQQRQRLPGRPEPLRLPAPARRAPHLPVVQLLRVLSRRHLLVPARHPHIPGYT